MTYSNIIDLDSSKETWVIQVCLCRLWEAINFKNDNEIMGLEMVFVDAQGDSIQAYIRKNHMKRFKPMFEEGQVYAIRNFRVARSAMQYKVVPNDLRIYFNITTSVRKVSPVPHQIPPNIFFFTTAEIHEQRVSNNTLLTDIIGCVAGVGNIQSVGNATKKDIELKNNDANIMKVTLWGTITEMFDLSPYEGSVAPLIAIITSTTIKRFKGEPVYASTSASRIYFNLDIPEVNELSLRFGEENEAIRMLEHAQTVLVPLAEQMSLNRRNIAQILGMEWVSDNQHMFTLMAKIVEIDQGYGWCYVSCNQCSKKLVPDNGSFVCNTCNKECSYPIIRYKIHVRVTDETGSTTLVLFNQEAEKLISSSASKFVTRLGVGNNTLPHEISKLVGKTFVFKIKLTDYNLKDGFENYTVVKIFDTTSTLLGNKCSPEKHEVEIDSKRKSVALTDDQTGEFPSKILAAAEVGAKLSGEGNSIHPVTPAKKPNQPKKLKSGK